MQHGPRVNHRARNVVVSLWVYSEEGDTVAQCQGKTKKGDRCKRDAKTGAAFCSIHVDQEIRARAERTSEWDSDAILKAAIGFAIVGAVFFLRFRR